MISGKNYNWNSELRQNFYVKRRVTNAELLALFTTAVTIVPAQPGFFMIPNAVHFVREAGTAYTLNASTAIGIYGSTVAGQALATVNPAGLMDQAAQTVAFANAPNALTSALGSFTGAQITALINAPLVIANAVANLTVGTGDLVVSLFYTQYPTIIGFN